MLTADIDKELEKIVKLIEQDEIKPSYINKTFQDDYGTKIDISWFDTVQDPIINQESLTKDVGIIRSMIESANLLVDNIDNAIEADLMFPAIMFCYMQYLELALKTIVKRNNAYYDLVDTGKKINLNNKRSGHDIINIWSQVKNIINDHMKLNSNEFSCIDAIIVNLTNLCNTSMGYRYAQDLNDKEYIDNKKFAVDLKVVCIWMNVLDEYLYNLYDEDWFNNL